MNKFLLSSLVGLFFLLSCSKDDQMPQEEPTPDYYYKCKVQGINSIFSNNPRAIRVSGLDYNISVLGGNETQAVGLNVSRGASTEPLTPGTYIQSSDTYKVLAAYHLDPDDIYYYGGYDQYFSAAINNTQIQHPFSITITEVNDKNIRGTFEGDVFEAGNVFEQVIHITEGEFFLPFKEY